MFAARPSALLSPPRASPGIRLDPVLVPVVCVVLGATLAVAPLPGLLALAASALALARRLGARLLVVALLGVGLGGWRASTVLDAHASAWEAARAFLPSPARCSGEGRVTSSPTLRGPNLRFDVELAAIDCEGRASSRLWPVRLYVPASSAPPLERGSNVSVIADLAPTSDYRNVDMPDPRPSAARRGAVLSGSALLVRLEQRSVSGRAFIDRARAHVRERILATFAPSVTGLARALVLGESDLDPADEHAFQRSGLSHLLAVSGTHLVLAVLALVRGLEALAKRAECLSARCDVRRPAALLGLCLAPLYADFAGGSGSAWRAAYMLCAVLGLRVLGRYPFPSRILACSLAGGWLGDALVVFDPSFMLSVGATTGLLVFGHGQDERQLARAAALTEPRRPELSRLVHAITRAALTTLAATLPCVPLLLSISPGLSLASVAANLLAAPLGEAVALPLCLLHALCWPLPTLERGVALVATGALALMRGIASTSASIEWLYIEVPVPNAWHLAVLAASVPLAIAPRARPWLETGARARAAGGLAAASTAGGPAAGARATSAAGGPAGASAVGGLSAMAETATLRAAASAAGSRAASAAGARAASAAGGRAAMAEAAALRAAAMPATHSSAISGAAFAGARSAMGAAASRAAAWWAATMARPATMAGARSAMAGPGVGSASIAEAPAEAASPAELTAGSRSAVTLRAGSPRMQQAGSDSARACSPTGWPPITAAGSDSAAVTLRAGSPLMAKAGSDALALASTWPARPSLYAAQRSSPVSTPCGPLAPSASDGPLRAGRTDGPLDDEWQRSDRSDRESSTGERADWPLEGEWQGRQTLSLRQQVARSRAAEPCAPAFAAKLPGEKSHTASSYSERPLPTAPFGARPPSATRSSTNRSSANANRSSTNRSSASPPSAWSRTWISAGQPIPAPPRQPHPRASRLAGAAILLGIGALLLVETATRWHHSAARHRALHLLRVTALDVGQGDATLIDLPDGRLMLIDGGGNVGVPVDPGERVILPILRARRRDRIDILVLTHPHPDHLGGLLSVARDLPIGELWYGGAPPPPGSDYQRLLDLLITRGVPLRNATDLCTPSATSTDQHSADQHSAAPPNATASNAATSSDAELARVAVPHPEATPGAATSGVGLPSLATTRSAGDASAALASVAHLAVKAAFGAAAAVSAELARATLPNLETTPGAASFRSALPSSEATPSAAALSVGLPNPAEKPSAVPSALASIARDAVTAASSAAASIRKASSAAASVLEASSTAAAGAGTTPRPITPSAAASSAAAFKAALASVGLAKVIAPPDTTALPAPSTTLQILHPCPLDPSQSLNDNSLVLRITHGQHAALLMGDAEHWAEERLLATHPTELTADLLKVGHHGSRTSSSPTFLQAVHPELATISAGIRNRFAHPHPETLDHLHNAGAFPLRLDQLGSITWQTDGNTQQVHTWLTG